MLPRMDQVSPEALRQAVECVAGTLAPYAEADWSVLAGELEWSCRRTLEHAVDTQIWYATHLATLAPGRRQRCRDGDPNGSVASVLDALVSASHILARVAEATPPGGRGFHPSGMADASGFIAMGCDEALVHGNDICAGLGAAYTPPGDICDDVVRRLFPWAPEYDDAWERLLWCNGRIALPGHARLTKEWNWWPAPLEEWDGVAYTDRSPI